MSKMENFRENIKELKVYVHTNIQFTSDQQGGGGVTEMQNVEISNMYLTKSRSRYSESTNYKCFITDVF